MNNKGKNKREKPEVPEKLLNSKIIAFAHDIFYEDHTGNTVKVEYEGIKAKMIRSCLSEELQSIFKKRGIIFKNNDENSRVINRSIKRIIDERIIEIAERKKNKKEVKIKYGGDTESEFVDVERNIVFWLAKNGIDWHFADCINVCGTNQQLELSNKAKTPTEIVLTSIMDKRKTYLN